MITKKQPKTSLDAYQSIESRQLNETYQSILSALEVLKSASAEQIAIYLGKEHEQINRRVSELEKQNKIYRNGKQALTKKGRLAYCWALIEQPIEVAKKVDPAQLQLF